MNRYCVAVHGSFEGVAGTSASCPVVAGAVPRDVRIPERKIEELLDHALHRRAAGCAPEGPAHPALATTE